MKYRCVCCHEVRSGSYAVVDGQKRWVCVICQGEGVKSPSEYNPADWDSYRDTFMGRLHLPR